LNEIYVNPFHKFCVSEIIFFCVVHYNEKAEANVEIFLGGRGSVRMKWLWKKYDYLFRKWQALCRGTFSRIYGDMYVSSRNTVRFLGWEKLLQNLC